MRTMRFSDLIPSLTPGSRLPLLSLIDSSAASFWTRNHVPESSDPGGGRPFEARDQAVVATAAAERCKAYAFQSNSLCLRDKLISILFELGCRRRRERRIGPQVE